MIMFLLSFLALCIVPSFAQNDSLTNWDFFKTKFKKVYSPSEETMRKAIFEYNLQKIETHNEQASNGLHSHFLGVNQFSDITENEFQRFLNQLMTYMSKQKDSEDDMMAFEDGEEYEKTKTAEELPKHVDWRTKGVVTPVKDQGLCGCCWAFSSVAAIESAWAMKTGKLVNLSVQQMLDCTLDQFTFGCEGGNMESGFEYVIQNKGIVPETCYPYAQKQHSRCRYKKRRCPVVTVSKFYDIPEGDEQAMQEALATYGPISAAINGDGQDFQHYQSGIYKSNNCQGEVSHGVLLVGYDTTEDGQDYWIAKNSWSSDWGMDGYFYLARNSKMCGIADMASFPVV